MSAHGPHPLGCPRCHKPVDVKSRHVSVAGSTIQVYCSDACLQGLSVLTASVEIVRPARRRWHRWWFAAGVALGGTTMVLYAVDRDIEVEAEQLAPVVALTPVPAAPPEPVPPPEPPGPSPEEKARQEADEALLEELLQDAWIHPLAGPVRRMPVNHTAAFGATRDNAPPAECLQGHCGVDVGHEWGEPIHVVHDGIIDWVNRGPNEDHGGVFVKVSHRDGTLFSWYFHLAAVPRWVRPGIKVTVGSVIGLLGDTGIKRSAPHLHFAMTVKAGKATRERYIDPEPLLALWPLWLPDEQKVSTTVAAPGVPVRGPARARLKRPAVPVQSAGSSEPVTDAPSGPAVPTAAPIELAAPLPMATVPQPSAAPAASP